MKVAISSTHDPKYLFYLPIATFCWNKLGVDVICITPSIGSYKEGELFDCAAAAVRSKDFSIQYASFRAPEEKKATYAQCSRLYAAAILKYDFRNNTDRLFTSDIDIIVFNKEKIYNEDKRFSVFGSDLVPDNQLPMCYISAPVMAWQSAFRIYCGKMDETGAVSLVDRSLQQCLDDLLGDIECEGFKGNMWCKDQNEAHRVLSNGSVSLIPRAKPGTQFASKRYDRDDAYILERLSLDTIDYHMNRPGYEDANFNIILTILKFHYPTEDFTWLINYQQKFKELL